MCKTILTTLTPSTAASICGGHGQSATHCSVATAPPNSWTQMRIPKLYMPDCTCANRRCDQGGTRGRTGRQRAAQWPQCGMTRATPAAWPAAGARGGAPAPGRCAAPGSWSFAAASAHPRQRSRHSRHQTAPANKFQSTCYMCTCCTCTSTDIAVPVHDSPIQQLSSSKHNSRQVLATTAMTKVVH